MESQETSPSAGDIELAGLLRPMVGRLVKLMRRETRNESQLSLTERSIMATLYPDVALAPSEIARMEKVTTQRMSQGINHLVELNYIGRTASDDDKRKVILRLTEAGRTRVEKARQEKQEWLAQVLYKRFTAEEKAVLLESIKIFSK